MLEIICKVMEVLLKEVHDAEEDRCKDCADTEDVEPEGEAEKHLRVHALEYVCAEDGSEGAGVGDVGIFMQEELGTSVITRDDRAHGDAGRAFSLRLNEEEVECFAFIQTGRKPALNILCSDLSMQSRKGLYKGYF